MTRELPDYLRPVPGPGDTGPTEATAAASDREPETSGPAGLIPPMRRGRSGSFITDVVVDLGYATREQVEQAISQSRTAGRAPEQILVEGGVIDTEQLSRATAERYGLDFVDLAVFGVDMGAANLITVKSARRHQTVPIAYVDDDTLLLAMADPANVLALADVQMATGQNCRVAVAPAQDIDALISKLGTLQSAVTEAIGEEDEAESEVELTDLRASAQDGPVIKLVNSILGQAVAEGASDIHFEPDSGDMRIRFRVDGVLMETARVPKRMVSGVISRMKIMSELDIAEKRVPQDGRVGVMVEDRRIDLRVTTLPTQEGEGISIRDLVTIIETLGDRARLTKDPALLAEYCRQALARQITAALIGPNGSITAITLDPTVEDEVVESIVQTPDGSYLGLDPGRAEDLVEALRGEVDRVAGVGQRPVVLCSARLRRHLRALIAHALPRVPVVSYHELAPNTTVDTVGVVGAPAAAVAA